MSPAAAEVPPQRYNGYGIARCSFLFLMLSCGVVAFPARHFVDAVDDFKRSSSRSTGGVHPLFLGNGFRVHDIVRTPEHARRLGGIMRLRFAWVALGALLGADPIDYSKRGSSGSQEGSTSTVEGPSFAEEAKKARKKISENHRRALYGERRSKWDSVLDEPAIQNLLKIVRTKEVAINSSDIPRTPPGVTPHHIGLPRIGLGLGGLCDRGHLADRHRGSYDWCERSFRVAFREQQVYRGKRFVLLYDVVLQLLWCWFLFLCTTIQHSSHSTVVIRLVRVTVDIVQQNSKTFDETTSARRGRVRVATQRSL